MQLEGCFRGMFAIHQNLDFVFLDPMKTGNLRELPGPNKLLNDPGAKPIVAVHIAPPALMG